MKKYSIILVLALLSITAYPQFAEDALRFSQNYYQGTARTMAVGGAFGALGADFSAASINPAGMGVFRTSELSITPEVFNRNVSSVYNGSLNESSKAVFDLSNLGYVVVKPLSKGNGWKFIQFGFGMNRINNFNSSLYMQGENSVNSKLDVYKDLADGQYYDNLESNDPYELYPAWYLYLIDTIPGTDDWYFTPVPFGGVLQRQQVITQGSTNEWLFSFSGNYNDFLYLGATIGLPYARYSRESSYAEFDNADTIPFFNNWSVTENLTTTGWGINLKLGAIVKPAEWLRIGGAFHTPTYYWSMSDSWWTNTTADLEWTDADSYTSIIGNFDYHLSTPLRVIGSTAFLIGTHGFISAEYEYVNYSSAKFSSQSFSYADVNSDIEAVYKATSNFRAGTEWRFSNFSLRGGYALYGSPYANNINDG
ncbi:MAG: hypothetical protein H8E34_01945, partial [Bacteroidetes bacterium]|nr:hypothetical protein [Bacteroidota bacterium]